jgi:molybdopterin converting factor subunit 1
MDPQIAVIMRVRVLLFAVLRDVAGVREIELDAPARANAAMVGRLIVERFPQLAGYMPRIAFAVNQNYVQGEAELHEGDEVALIPPVSGGCG